MTGLCAMNGAPLIVSFYTRGRRENRGIFSSDLCVAETATLPINKMSRQQLCFRRYDQEPD